MKTLNFETAFKYPFNRGTGMLNIFWLLVPILGWFALLGFSIKIMKEFTQGKFKQLPIFEFGNDLKLGFMMFLKGLVFFLPYGILVGILKYFTPVGDLLGLFIEIFIIPILIINFVNKQTIESLFEFELVSVVFNNIGDYLIAIIKSIGLFFVYLLMVIILVGFPAMAFTNNMFLADFYRRHIIKK
jgi:hypothetical protein